MEIDVTEGEETGVPTPEVSLEISSEIAEQAEELLSEFAEDAGLETALIVDRGGALVAGISSEEDVTVDVISGLVAGASSAMRALVDQLGDTGEIESLHQGGKRLLYIREIVTRFVLVGVSDASFPPGIVREKAAQLQPKLAELLQDVKPLDPPEPETVEKPKSLRAVAAERAAARVKVEILQRRSSGEEPEAPEYPGLSEGEDIFEIADDAAGRALPESTGADAAMEPVPLEDESEEEASTREPVEVLEPLDFGEPEIVIEKSPLDEDERSPFELAEDADSSGEPGEGGESEEDPGESVFELEEREEETKAVEPTVFEWVDEDEEPDVEGLTGQPKENVISETVFEYDEAEEGGGNGDDELIHESGPDDSHDREEESNEEESNEEESNEEESHNSGPLYF